MQDHKTNQLIERLRQQSPTLSQPGQLTDSIMDALPVKETGNRSWLPLVRVISSSAAVLLIGMYLYQQSAVYNPTVEQTVDNVIQSSSFNFHPNDTDRTSLYESYKRYLKQNKQENLRSRQIKHFNTQQP